MYQILCVSKHILRFFICIHISYVSKQVLLTNHENSVFFSKLPFLNIHKHFGPGKRTLGIDYEGLRLKLSFVPYYLSVPELP